MHAGFASELFKGRNFKINARGRDRFEFYSPYSVEIKDLDGLQQLVQQEINQARLNMIELSQAQQRLKQLVDQVQAPIAPPQRPAPPPPEPKPEPKVKTPSKPLPPAAATPTPETKPKRRLSGRKYLEMLRASS